MVGGVPERPGEVNGADPAKRTRLVSVAGQRRPGNVGGTTYQVRSGLRDADRFRLLARWHVEDAGARIVPGASGTRGLTAVTRIRDHAFPVDYHPLPAVRLKRLGMLLEPAVADFALALYVQPPGRHPMLLPLFDLTHLCSTAQPALRWLPGIACRIAPSPLYVGRPLSRSRAVWLLGKS